MFARSLSLFLIGQSLSVLLAALCVPRSSIDFPTFYCSAWLAGPFTSLVGTTWRPIPTVFSIVSRNDDYEPMNRVFVGLNNGEIASYLKRARNSSSVRTSTPRLSALASLLPAFSPAMTKSVFLLTLPADRPPRASMRALISSRV